MDWWENAREALRAWAEGNESDHEKARQLALAVEGLLKEHEGRLQDHEGCRRAFTWSTKTWYHLDEYGDEVVFGMYAPEGGTSGEMVMRWQGIGGRAVPQLRVFDEAWSALSTFGDLLNELAKVDGLKITQEEFVEILLRCGFVDDTKYKSPYAKWEASLRAELMQIEKRKKEIEQKLEEL